ncbi:MAG: KOW domain-containing RNA-binding protein [Lachnospiraceae bacterium]|nr:KOW domain-containing RNA-binding protein [Lachnospiraceae bacterium]MDD7327893.1 KOW domain-containing RNA-binding protein [Lachnospiraceae bacterium]MDY2759716.1 KOW domain-containing RNA-binding protein [Lachnospiraceae bacterium]
MTLLMGRSLAGHDKGQVYVILREEGQNYILANGTNRSVLSPKRKNQKHIQLIKNFPEEVLDISKEENDYRDLWVKRVIRIYNDSVTHNS